jgi:hypothetical protein
MLLLLSVLLKNRDRSLRNTNAAMEMRKRKTKFQTQMLKGPISNKVSLNIISK